MKRQLLQIYVLVILVSLTGCASSIKIREMPVADATDVSLSSTYSWDRSSLVTIAPAEKISTEYSVIIRAEIDQALVSLGYRKVNTGPVDMIMDFRLTINDLVTQFPSEADVLETIDYQSPYGLRWHFGKGEKLVHLDEATSTEKLGYYEEGTLHIGAFSQKKKLAWHATANKIINQNHLPAAHEKVIRNTVRLIMTRFPPHRDSSQDQSFSIRKSVVVEKIGNH